ncbi:hypothetical protein E0485_13815 [Paenibacillus albiflavus]|uniref:Flagellin C-terminal domain-containing protein n=2 Tax=Paenibacillus albiflavus TaxID=2545760 RepID=A0A4R4ECH4_9BACL|nr:hypothetical protein E0485_13815 [Paenibacillus albiflavus]
MYFPIGTTDVPRTVNSSQTDTVITDNYTTDTHTSPITSPDGRDGVNQYEKNEHIHTESTVTEEYSYERLFVSDPRFKELAVHTFDKTDVHHVSFQPSLIPNAITVGQYPDFGGLNDYSIYVNIDGVSTSLKQFTLTSSTITPNGISAIYEKDGIQLEKMMSTDGSSFKAEFKITNNSGIDQRKISVNMSFKPMYDAKYSISSPSGVPVGGTATSEQIPNSETVFSLSNEFVDFDFSFLSGGVYGQPDSVTTSADSTLSLTHDIIPSWENANFNDGDVLQFGIQLSNFNIKKDVYRVTNDITSQVDFMDQTVTTDIKDIDYITPSIEIQDSDQADQKLYIPLFNVDTDGLGITNIGVLPPANPNQSLNQLDHALSTILTFRGIYGALQNRMEHTMNNVNNSTINLSAAESRIRDADIANEMVALTKSNILTQTTQAMLTIANQNPQGVLQILK